MPNWNNAVPETRKDFPSLHTQVGAHNAFFVGFTETWVDTSACYDRRNPDHGNSCKKCKGSNSVTQEMIGLKYEMPDGHIEQEQVSFKVTAPGRTKSGDPLRSSKLFERLVEFTRDAGNTGKWGPGDMQMWAEKHEICHIPVIVVIKQPGNYAKIVEVLYRAGTAPVARVHTPQADMSITERATQNAQATDEHPFEDEEPLPF